MAIRNAMEKIISFILAAGMLGMTAMAFWLVVGRYTLASHNSVVKAIMAVFPDVLRRLTVFSTTITEELLRFALIWLAFIGSAHVFGKKGHLAFTLIHERVRSLLPGWGKYLDAALHLLIIAFVGIVLVYGGWLMVVKNLNQFSPILRWSMGWVYSVLPLSGILMIFFEACNVYDSFCGGGAAEEHREGKA